ncbi:hypothetical protein L345_12775, partial [Ophiophagus hannah]
PGEAVFTLPEAREKPPESGEGKNNPPPPWCRRPTRPRPSWPCPPSHRAVNPLLKFFEVHPYPLGAPEDLREDGNGKKRVGAAELIVWTLKEENGEGKKLEKVKGKRKLGSHGKIKAIRKWLFFFLAMSRVKARGKGGSEKKKREGGGGQGKGATFQLSKSPQLDAAGKFKKIKSNKTPQLGSTEALSFPSFQDLPKMHNSELEGIGREGGREEGKRGEREREKERKGGRKRGREGVREGGKGEGKGKQGGSKEGRGKGRKGGKGGKGGRETGRKQGGEGKEGGKEGKRGGKEAGKGEREGGRQGGNKEGKGRREGPGSAVGWKGGTSLNPQIRNEWNGGSFRHTSGPQETSQPKAMGKQWVLVKTAPPSTHWLHPVMDLWLIGKQTQPDQTWQDVREVEVELSPQNQEALSSILGRGRNFSLSGHTGNISAKYNSVLATGKASGQITWQASDLPSRGGAVASQSGDCEFDPSKRSASSIQLPRLHTRLISAETPQDYLASV